MSRRRTMRESTKPIRGRPGTKTRLLLSAALLVSFAAIVFSQQSDAPDGFYTKAQATRGEGLYDANCASCHGLRLESGVAAPLKGSRFMAKWGKGHSVDELYYITRTQMPYGAGGKLSSQQYIDIVAYILKMNGYPQGKRE